MAMDAFVPLTADGGRGNEGTGIKPAGRTARPALRAVVRMAAQPVRWLWKDQLALGTIAMVAGAANVGKSLLVTGDFAAQSNPENSGAHRRDAEHAENEGNRK